VLLTYQGWGHGLYVSPTGPGRSPCTDTAITHYLISLHLPAPPATCPAIEPPPTTAPATGPTHPQ
jgi:hypothetical protein